MEEFGDELRFLLVPEVTDNDRELDGLIEFVSTLGGDVRVKLNAFQHHGVRPQAREWEKMSKSGVDRAAERLAARLELLEFRIALYRALAGPIPQPEEAP